MSKADRARFLESVHKCKHVVSNSGKTELEVILQKDSDKMLVLETKGVDYDKAGRVSAKQQRDSDAESSKMCPTTKYTVDKSGIKDFKVFGNKFWMVSNDGQVYFANASETFYELLTSGKESYKSVTGIKGDSNDPDTARLLMKNNPDGFAVTPEVLAERIRQGKVRELKFVKYHTDRSIFRDE